MAATTRGGVCNEPPVSFPPTFSPRTLAENGATRTQTLSTPGRLHCQHRRAAHRRTRRNARAKSNGGWRCARRWEVRVIEFHLAKRSAHRRSTPERPWRRRHQTRARSSMAYRPPLEGMPGGSMWTRRRSEPDRMSVARPFVGRHDAPPIGECAANARIATEGGDAHGGMKSGHPF